MSIKNRLTAMMCLCLIILFMESDGKAEGAYGYIDRDGYPVIPCQFDYAYEFYNGRAKVFSGTLNRNGYPAEGAYGFINEDGELIIPYIYDRAADFDQNEQAVVSTGGKYGIIDLNGETVVRPEYKNLWSIGSSGLYMAYMGEASPEKNGMKLYAVLRADGTEVFHGEFEDITAYTWCCVIGQNGKKALLSLEGELITDFVYDEFSRAQEDGIVYKVGQLYGYMDYQGNELTGPIYQAAGALNDGRAIVKRDQRYYSIDRSGNELATYNVDYMSLNIYGGVTYAFSGKLDKTGWPEDGMFYLIDLESGNRIGREYSASNYYAIDKESWLVKENGVWYAVDLAGQEIISGDELHQCGNDRFLVGRDGYFALADDKGNVLTDYTWVGYNSYREGLICVKAPD